MAESETGEASDATRQEAPETPDVVAPSDQPNGAADAPAPDESDADPGRSPQPAAPPGAAPHAAPAARFATILVAALAAVTLAAVGISSSFHLASGPITIIVYFVCALFGSVVLAGVMGAAANEDSVTGELLLPTLGDGVTVSKVRFRLYGALASFAFIFASLVVAGRFGGPLPTEPDDIRVIVKCTAADGQVMPVEGASVSIPAIGAPLSNYVTGSGGVALLPRGTAPVEAFESVDIDVTNQERTFPRIVGSSRPFPGADIVGPAGVTVRVPCEQPAAMVPPPSCGEDAWKCVRRGDEVRLSNQTEAPRELPCQGLRIFTGDDQRTFSIPGVAGNAASEHIVGLNDWRDWPMVIVPNVDANQTFDLMLAPTDGGRTVDVRCE